MHHGNLLPWLQLATAPLGPWQPTFATVRSLVFPPSIFISSFLLSLSAVYLVKPLPAPSLTLAPSAPSQSLRGVLLWCRFQELFSPSVSLDSLVSFTEAPSVLSAQQSAHTVLCVFACVCMFLKLRWHTGGCMCFCACALLIQGPEQPIITEASG